MLLKITGGEWIDNLHGELFQRMIKPKLLAFAFIDFFLRNTVKTDFLYKIFI